MLAVWELWFKRLLVDFEQALIYFCVLKNLFNTDRWLTDPIKKKQFAKKFIMIKNLFAYKRV